MGILGYNSPNSTTKGTIGGEIGSDVSRLYYIKITTPDNNITVDSASAYMIQKSGEPTITYKYIIYNSNSSLHSMSPEGTFYSGTRIWGTINFTNPKPVLLANTDYYLGVVGKPEDNLVYLHGYTLSPANANTKQISTYTNGGSITPASDGTLGSTYLSLYLTYTDGGSAGGPSFKIEGITPGKLEGTSWSSLATVR